MSKSRKIESAGLAALFKALAHPNRLRIFQRLLACSRPDAAGGGAVCRCVGELGERLGIAPSTVSHHIKELHLAGLVRLERRGQKVEVRLEAEAIGRLAGFLGEASSCGRIPPSPPARRRGASTAGRPGKGACR